MVAWFVWVSLRVNRRREWLADFFEGWVLIGGLWAVKGEKWVRHYAKK